MIPFHPEAAVAVVTGAAGGIGAALVRELAAAGARAVVVADLDSAGAERVAATIPEVGHARGLDVTNASAVRDLVAWTEAAFGPIGLWWGNAGVAAGMGLADEHAWSLSWDLHVRAHVLAAETLLPRMVERGRGHLVLTASAAGLLTQLDSAAYAATKHATVALAEWLAITYADVGVGVGCLCPQAVRTAMTEGQDSVLAAAGEALEPAQVAAAAMADLAAGHFLLLPHPEVAQYERTRAADRDRWLAGMSRLRRRIRSETATPDAPRIDA
ncbi:MAG TPA: SDR family oxidoreductase [Micromonosporaceae bacterium]|nr:SDR family oxidoreductase [Micromonosporaceae bacterium]